PFPLRRSLANAQGRWSVIPWSPTLTKPRRTVSQGSYRPPPRDVPQNLMRRRTTKLTGRGRSGAFEVSDSDHAAPVGCSGWFPPCSFAIDCADRGLTEYSTRQSIADGTQPRTPRMPVKIHCPGSGYRNKVRPPPTAFREA